jgi:peptidylprolyl isomerase domain and WD repeat-containing protein 1
LLFLFNHFKTILFYYRSDEASGTIYVYDGRQDGNEALKVLDSIHRNPVSVIRYNPIYDCTLSIDTSGMVEYWSGHKSDFQFPRNLKFESKLDTDLFQFVKEKVKVHTVCLSPNGKLFAAFTSGRKVYIELIL